MRLFKKRKIKKQIRQLEQYIAEKEKLIEELSDAMDRDWEDEDMQLYEYIMRECDLREEEMQQKVARKLRETIGNEENIN